MVTLVLSCVEHEFFFITSGPDFLHFVDIYILIPYVPVMSQLHLPRSSYNLFVYDFRYDFSGTAEYTSMQTVR